MGFVVGTQEEKLHEKPVKGQYRKAAVSCWFTVKGRAIPQMLKFEDEEGFRHKIEHIRVLKSEQKCYAGIQMQRYDCEAEINGVMRAFTLLYHPGENTWDMVLRE